MRRRHFIFLSASLAITPRFAARAQQATLPLIGFLSGATPDGFRVYLEAFRKGLGEAGYIEGQNVAIEYRWAEGQYDRLPTLADDLVGRHVTILVATGGNPPAQAAKAATSAIPIVFVSGGDPISGGLVSSLNRPSGNVTGISWTATALVPKRLDLLRQLVGNSVRQALLSGRKLILCKRLPCAISISRSHP
jgi:putative tryptophan/tyrosine transport system substrate-binding protein